MFKSKRSFELSPRMKLGVGRNYSQNSLLKFSAIFCLLLAFGLSINAVHLIFSNSTAKINPIESGNPQVLGAIDVKNTQSEGPNFVEYKILKGDTLFSISQKFNINWATIASLNNLKSPFSLKPGQTIKMPK